MTHVKKRFNHDAGLTLAETAIVLAVVSVIIGAIWIVSAVVYENARQYQANRQLQTIVQNVRQLYARVNVLTNFADVTATLDAQAAFPIEMRVNQGNPTGVLNHPWASVATGSVNIFNRTASSFGVIFSSLPQKACIGLATKLTGGDLTNLLQVVINNNVITGANLPVSIVTANTACGNTTAINSVEWIFDIRG